MNGTYACVSDTARTDYSLLYESICEESLLASLRIPLFRSKSTIVRSALVNLFDRIRTLSMYLCSGMRLFFPTAEKGVKRAFVERLSDADRHQSDGYDVYVGLFRNGHMQVRKVKQMEGGNRLDILREAVPVTIFSAESLLHCAPVRVIHNTASKNRLHSASLPMYKSV